MSANAVGITQLVVPDVQLQPNLAGSNLTLLSTVLSFHRQNQFASRPRASNSHWIPDANRFVSVPGRHQAQDGKSSCPAPLWLVAHERRPASVAVLETIERLYRPAQARCSAAGAMPIS